MLTFKFLNPGSIKKILIALFILLNTSILFAQDNEKAKPIKTPVNPQYFIGGFIGATTGRTEAVKDFPDTELNTGLDFGINAGLLFSKSITGLEFSAEHYTMELTENDVSFGSLEMTPVLIKFILQKFPKNFNGFAWHGKIGIGYSFNSFSEGSDIKSLESQFQGVNISIETDPSFVFELGFGFDYFFSKNVSFIGDAIFKAGNINTSWTADDGVAFVKIPDIDTFQATAFQLNGGFKYWF